MPAAATSPRKEIFLFPPSSWAPLTLFADRSSYYRDQARETVGIFLCKPYYRPAENQFIMCPPEVAKRLPPQAQRLLGYGISLPALGFVEYQDPMRYLFGVEDDETVNM